jgi:hypothetical protein
VVCPRVSVAMAARVCAPLEAEVVFHKVANVGPVPVTAAPRFAPSSWNCTDAIPAVAVAFAITVTVPDRLPPVGLVMLIAGAEASETLTPLDVVVCPRVSVAMAVRVCAPLEAEVVFHKVAKVGPVPVTVAPRFAPSSWNCTDAIPAVEVAFAVTVTVPDRLPPVGLVMLTAGADVLARV